MDWKTKLVINSNNFFKKQVHPFNLANDGKMSYAEWQFQKGENTLKFYLKKYTLDEMFKDKIVLDIGCGAAGKSLYYASNGTKKVICIDVVERYKNDALSFAKEKHLENKFEFVLGDAAKLPFENESIDTIIMNDAVEHVDKPEQVLSECLRVLKKGGRLYANFPPYNHPFGAHLSDAINMPWVHLFFSDKTLISAYKELMKEYPDGDERINFRISKDKNGDEYFSYINKMTIKRFKKIKENFRNEMVYYKEEPLRNFFTPACKVPG